MVVKFGGWFELECCGSYGYARIGRREVFVQLAGRRCAWSTAERSDYVHRYTFRVGP
jgi:hypothetical protein